MTYHCHKSWIFIFLCMLPLLAWAQKTGNPKFSARVNTVSIDLEVLDNAGNPVENLAPKDLIVKEDGHPMKITHLVQLHNQPVSLAILLDTSAIENDKLDEAKQFIFQIIYHLDRLDDISLFTLTQKSADLAVDFTTDRTALVSALDNIYAIPKSNDTVPKELFEPAPPTALGIDMALLRLRESRHIKKALLVVSNRFRGLGPVTVKHVQESGCTLLTLDFDNTLDAILTLGADQISRNQLVHESGGRRFSAETKDLDGVCQAIVHCLKNYYAVAYQTEIKPGDVKPRHIEVQAPNHKYTINSRRSYIPGKQ